MTALESRDRRFWNQTLAPSIDPPCAQRRRCRRQPHSRVLEPGAWPLVMFRTIVAANGLRPKVPTSAIVCASDPCVGAR